MLAVSAVRMAHAFTPANASALDTADLGGAMLSPMAIKLHLVLDLQ